MGGKFCVTFNSFIFCDAQASPFASRAHSLAFNIVRKVFQTEEYIQRIWLI